MTPWNFSVKYDKFSNHNFDLMFYYERYRTRHRNLNITLSEAQIELANFISNCNHFVADDMPTFRQKINKWFDIFMTFIPICATSNHIRNKNPGIRVAFLPALSPWSHSADLLTLLWPLRLALSYGVAHFPICGHQPKWSVRPERKRNRLVSDWNRIYPAGSFCFYLSSRRCNNYRWWSPLSKCLWWKTLKSLDKWNCTY